MQIAIVFCLSAESRLISTTTYASRDDIDVVLKSVKTTFDTAKLKAADAPDSSAYQSLISLAGSLTSHLATVSRPLPRMIVFTMPTTYPALALSQRVYYTADRFDELIDENKIVHPAFCPKLIRGLSA